MHRFATVVALLLLPGLAGFSAVRAREAKPAMETVAVMATTQGEVVIRFFPDKAPEHVKNFMTLARTGEYDNTYFHRVIPDFMVQGGDFNTKDDDPSNDGQGGWSYKGRGSSLKAEFNDTPHLRGVLSMARSQSPDSAGSQFFIMVKDNQGLDGQYTAFGRVIEGMDAVDRIVHQPGTPIPGAGGVNPHERQRIESIRFEERTAEAIYFAETALYGNALRLPVVRLETGEGEIALGLRGDKAPEHVRNFLHHVRAGLYDGTAFHRVVPGGLVHGGDPLTRDADPANDGTGGHASGGEGTTLPMEPNDLPHLRGTLAMFHGEDPDSAGSQFMILLKAHPEMDGAFTAFGEVVLGLEVAGAIASRPGAARPGGDGVTPAKPQILRKAVVEWWSPSRIADAAYLAEKAQVLEALKTPRGRQHVAILETTQGTIYIKFFPDKAPVHVHNFLEHCRSGFYEGTYFHRVFPGFMIQGGDPNTKDDDKANDGQGGYGYRGEGTFLRAEFNDVNHVRGVLSMARSADPDSAGSQFFIMVADNPGLDGKYSAFGQVISGMRVVDKIVSQPGTPIPGAGGNNPDRPQRIERATVEIWTDGKVRQYERRRD